MPLLPESPRARRRLWKLVALAVLVVIGVAVAVLIPSKGSTPDTPTANEGPAQLAVQSHVKLTHADRLAIDEALDRFLPAAMERKDMRLGWQLAGPELRADSSLAQWLKGNTAVPRYLAVEKTFHTWQTIDNGVGYVIFNLGVHPQKGFDEPPTIFSGEVVKEHGVWKVNRLYAVSLEYKITKTTHEVGPADFGAGAVYHPPPPARGKHSDRLLPILGIFVVILLIPLTVGAIALFRARRWKKELRARGEVTLPPLPSSYREAQAKSAKPLSQR